MTSAAADFVETLHRHGIARVYCVPGESYLTLLDAFFDQPAIDVVTCRHEGGAALMAVAETKLLDRPAVCMVSRGPGATNAGIGVHLAQQDLAPLVLVVGDVCRSEAGRGAFQEVDYSTSLGGLAKWTHVVTGPAALAESLARAMAIASRAPAGPVVLVVPEDIFEGEGEGPCAPLAGRITLGADAAPVEAVAAALAGAERPLLVGGSRLRSAESRAALVAAAERWGLPVATTYKQQDIFPNDHPHYAGHLGFKIPERFLDAYLGADLVLAVGTRLGDVPSQGYRFPASASGRQRLIHVNDDPGAIGRVLPVELGIVADPGTFLTRLAAKPASIPSSRAAWIEQLNALARPVRWSAGGGTPLEVGLVVEMLSQSLPDDAIVITDAGNFSGWVHRHFVFTGNRVLIGGMGGAMGLGVPAAVAASLEFPNRPAIAFVGDGGFMMTGAELATACATGAKPKIIVCNNGSLGTIRMHQERAYPGRVIATDLVNPDFAVLARAYGAYGATIRTAADAEGAIAGLLAHDGPGVVDLIVSPDRLAPGLTVDAVRSASAR